MRRAVFIAPYFADTTVRFIRAALSLEGVRLALVSHEPADKIPGGIAGRLAAYVQTRNALESGSLERGVRAAAEQIGGVDTILGAMEELQLPMAEGRDSLGVPGMTPRVAANFRGKGRMKDVFRAAGIPCARHAVATDRAAAEAFAARSGFPLVVKPPSGSGARSTFRIDSAEAFGDLLETLPPSPGEPALLEEFIVGKEHSFDSVMIGGEPGATLVKTVSVVPTQAGAVTLPAVTVGWWNTVTKSQDYATLPPVTFTVAPAASPAAPPPAAATGSAPPAREQTPQTPLDPPA